MRKELLVVGVVVVCASRVWAGDFCELLHKKGVLSEEEVDACERALGSGNQNAGRPERAEAPAIGQPGQVKAAGAWSYKLGTGFLWESSDRAEAGYGDETAKPRFSLALGNRLQVRYTFADRNLDDSSDSSAFRIRRFKFFLNGNAFYPWLRYKLQADWVGGHGTDGNRPDLDDAFVDLAYFPFLSVQLGQFKVPFNRQELTSSGALQFVDRAITNARFTLGRDQGVMIHGFVGPVAGLEYSAGVFNGNGKNRVEKEDSDHMGAARINWTPLGPMKYSESDLENSQRPKLAIGVAYVFNVVHSTSTTQSPRTTTLPDPSAPGSELQVQVGTITTSRRQDAEYHRGTIDAHIHWRGASALAEYFLESRDDKSPHVSVTESLFGQPPVSTTSVGPARGVSHTHGFNVQAGYFLIPATLEVAARYAVVDPAGVENRQEELRGGIGYFLFGHSLKLQADAGQVATQRAGLRDRRDLELRTQLQAIF